MRIPLGDKGIQALKERERDTQSKSVYFDNPFSRSEREEIGFAFRLMGMRREQKGWRHRSYEIL